jgi:RNA polymerase sigma-70 factor (ECF subfamily)
MSGPWQTQTRISLLARLAQPGPVDQTAWREFVEHYGPMIFKWCRRWNLQEADARDVTQQVLLKLALKMNTFTYDADRSFRAWLRTLTHHAWRDFVSDQQRPGKGSGDAGVLASLTTVEAREDLLRRLEEEFDLEVLEEAISRVRQRVEPSTWEAFRLTAVEAVPAVEVARRLNKKVATIYVARSKVQRMLQEEVQQLRGQDGT